MNIMKELRYLKELSVPLYYNHLALRTHRVFGSQLWNRVHMKLLVGYHGTMSTGTSAAMEGIPSTEHQGGQLREILWNLCNNGRLKEAADTLQLMDQRCTLVDNDTYNCLLQACIGTEALAEGKRVYDHMVRAGTVPDIFLVNQLLDMYWKCGSVLDARQMFDEMPVRNVFSWNMMISGYAKGGNVEDARQVFDEMPDRNVVSWNTIIAGYTQNGHAGEALKLFWQMRQEDLEPDKVTFAAAVSACARLIDVGQGKQVHALIIRTGFGGSIYVGNALVGMYSRSGRIEDAVQVFDAIQERDVVSWTSVVAGYAKCGRMADARHVFDKMPERNMVSWNAMIAGYAQNGYGAEALKFFRDMQQAEARPTLATSLSVLGACAGLASLETGKQIHGHLVRIGFESSVSVAIALVDMYAKCGGIENAHRVFNGMPERNVVVHNAMISGYFKCKRVYDAQLLFDSMLERDVVSWNAMIAGYAQNGYGEKALELFREMQWSDIRSTQFTIVSALKACSSVAAIEHGKQVHAHIFRNGFESNVFMGNALIDMYAKCGSIGDARIFFSRMPERDRVSWNSIIAGCAQNGYGNEAVRLFEQMLRSGTRPDCVTFICILSACSYAGLVNEGRHYFDSMIRDHFITPTADHYTCMIDLLGRAGQLDEALSFINNMPLEPDASMWGALLGACKMHGNLELGEHVARCLFDLEPHNAARYVMLSDIYAAACRWDGVAKMRKMIKERRMTKKAGHSWIEVKNSMHVFQVGGS